MQAIDFVRAITPSTSIDALSDLLGTKRSILPPYQVSRTPPKTRGSTGFSELNSERCPQAAIMSCRASPCLTRAICERGMRCSPNTRVENPGSFLQARHTVVLPTPSSVAVSAVARESGFCSIASVLIKIRLKGRLAHGIRGLAVPRPHVRTPILGPSTSTVRGRSFFTAIRRSVEIHGLLIAHSIMSPGGRPHVRCCGCGVVGGFSTNSCKPANKHVRK